MRTIGVRRRANLSYTYASMTRYERMNYSGRKTKNKWIMTGNVGWDKLPEGKRKRKLGVYSLDSLGVADFFDIIPWVF